MKLCTSCKKLNGADVKLASNRNIIMAEKKFNFDYSVPRTVVVVVVVVIRR